MGEDEEEKKVVVSWALGLSDGSWGHLNYIHEVKVIMREMGIILKHIPRCQNGVADRLAK